MVVVVRTTTKRVTKWAGQPQKFLEPGGVLRTVLRTPSFGGPTVHMIFRNDLLEGEEIQTNAEIC